MRYLGLIFLALLALLILRREGLLTGRRAGIAAAAAIVGAMLLRALCMEHETLDYQNFLAPWVRFFRENGGFAALKQPIGNYNVPYLYFLALFSYLPIRDLYLIKWLSVLFDVLLAWAVLRMVGLFRRERAVRLGAFCAALFLPTVVLNGAYWGQCDSVYAAFALWSLYFALADRPAAAVCAIALSFAFKLQAVFLMPAFLLFIFARKLKWRHLLLFPLTYFLSVLPAVLLGRPLKDALLFYFGQTGSIGAGLNYNSPSVFAFVRGDVDTAALSRTGIALAFALLALVFVYSLWRRAGLDRRALLTASLLIAVMTPYFLPHMHDRYFFLADVLALAFAFVRPRWSLIPVGVSFASLLGYHAYLKMRYLLPMRYGAAALLLVILALMLCYVRDLQRDSEKKRLTNRGNLI